MSEEKPTPEVWDRIRRMVHEKASSDAEEFVEATRRSESTFVDEMMAFDPSKPWLYDTGRKPLAELQKMAGSANDLANASRSVAAWNAYGRTPDYERTGYAKKIIRGAVRKDAREQS